MEHWTGKESRWCGRIEVNFPVKLSADTVTVADGYMKNLSLGGALVKADVDLGLHFLLQVSISVPSTPQRTEVVAAYIARRFKEGVGIEWCQFAPIVIKDLLSSPSIQLPL